MLRRKKKEKSITFFVPIKKESNEDNAIIYRIKFIDSFRFMIYVVVVVLIWNILLKERVVDYYVNALIVKEDIQKDLVKN